MLSRAQSYFVHEITACVLISSMNKLHFIQLYAVALDRALDGKLY